MSTRNCYISFFPLIILLLSACSAVKRVPEGEYLLVKNSIEVVVDDRSLDKSELKSILKQRPNKKILGVRFYLTMYNWPDPERLEAKRRRQEQRRDKKDDKRATKGKDLKDYKRVKGQWLQEVVGEAPVILEDELTERSRVQLELYLAKKGFFRNHVSDTIIYPKKTFSKKIREKRAMVKYHIHAGAGYKINEIKWQIPDERLRSYLFEEDSIPPNTLIRSGKNFDTDIMEKERQRITRLFQDLGYFYFTKDHITIDADSSLNTNKVNVKVNIHNSQILQQDGTTTTGPHQVFYLDQITIDTDFRPSLDERQPSDTVAYGAYDFLYLGKMRYKPKLLLRSVLVQKNDRYGLTAVENTYKRLSSLRVFRTVNIEFDTLNTSFRNGLNCYMRLNPAKERSFSVETNGTNRGGYLGIAGSVSFRHKNIFKGTETLVVKVTGGLEAQQPISNNSDEGTDVNEEVFFNTIEFGQEISLQIPKFLIPVNANKFSKSIAPKTVITAQYSFQQRPDFTRTLSKLSFGYNWNETAFKSWQVYPIEASVILIPRKSQEFIDYIEEVNDPFLINSYTDHFILGPRVVFTFNNQQISKPRNVIYYRGTIEAAGNLLNGMHSLSGKELETDTIGASYYTSFGIRYAQYIRQDNDLRFYRRFHDKSMIVYRVAAGIGIPYGNLDVMPFEKSFFVGGANGLRAWRARSIGPGSYFDPDNNFDKIGEIRIESNIEYRFDLIHVLEGALFVDVGNIWLIHEEPNKPGSGFSNDFISEIAVGAGIGARLDFDFFLIRFDLGLQMKDPSLPKGERWLFQPKDQYVQDVLDLTGVLTTYNPQLNFNLGIGYPF